MNNALRLLAAALLLLVLIVVAGRKQAVAAEAGSIAVAIARAPGV